MLRSAQCLLVCPTVTGKAFNKKCKIYLTALVMFTVSHQTSYYISSVVMSQPNKSKEIQCGATFGHAVACVSPSRVRPPVV